MSAWLLPGRGTAGPSRSRVPVLTQRECFLPWAWLWEAPGVFILERFRDGLRENPSGFRPRGRWGPGPGPRGLAVGALRFPGALGGLCGDGGGGGGVVLGSRTHLITLREMCSRHGDAWRERFGRGNEGGENCVRVCVCVCAHTECACVAVCLYAVRYEPLFGSVSVSLHMYGVCVFGNASVCLCSLC